MPSSTRRFISILKNWTSFPTPRGTRGNLSSVVRFVRIRVLFRNDRWPADDNTMLPYQMSWLDEPKTINTDLQCTHRLKAVAAVCVSISFSYVYKSQAFCGLWAPNLFGISRNKCDGISYKYISLSRSPPESPNHFGRGVYGRDA